MVKTSHAYERLGQRYRRGLIFFSFFVAVVLISAALFVFLAKAGGQRVAVVIASDPVTVALLDRNRHKLTVLSFPATAQISGAYGTGKYSLSSFWKLGAIDNSDIKLLPASIGQTIGIPTPLFIGRKGESLPVYKDGTEAIRNTFSAGNIISFLSGKFVSDITIPEFLSMVSTILNLRPDDIITLVASPETVLTREKLGDGSLVWMVDPDRLDILVGKNFEDDEMRAESLHVAVYNTTPAPSLGSRAERILKHAGILVVLLANDSPEIGVCTLSGREKLLRTQTADFLVKVFGCRKMVSEENDRADLILRLGKDYEKRFLPEH